MQGEPRLTEAAPHLRLAVVSPPGARDRFGQLLLAIAAVAACSASGDEMTSATGGADGDPATAGTHAGHGTGATAAHGDLPPAPAMLDLDPWDGDLALAEIADENSDLGVIEVSLTAAPAAVEYVAGRSTVAWTYNGGVPGPLLRAKVGDRIVVHFVNELPEETTIHWHGMRVPAAMDGTTATQAPVASGASFDYEFTALDAGTFWYHPHVRSDRQVEQGLYGPIVVEDPSEPLSDLPADVVMLSDVLVDPVTFALDDAVDARTAMMGREGNLVLVNGMPANVRLPARAGDARRLRIVNAASARFFDLMPHGGTMIRIGGDRGLLEQPEVVDHLLLTNGERADVLVWTDTPGATATLVTMPYERAEGAGATELVTLMQFVADDREPVPAMEVPAPLVSAAESPTAMTERTIRLNEAMMPDGLRFLINDASFPDVPVLEPALGTSERWQIVNESSMDHPFHLHGFFFWVAERSEWKDSVDVPADTTLVVEPYFDARDGAAGSWMYHCHILGHAEGGMMGELDAR